MGIGFNKVPHKLITRTKSDKDVDNFAKVQYALEPKFYNVNRSLRLNVFEGIDISALNLERWKVKDNMVWLENCPLPKDEVFMRY